MPLIVGEQRGGRLNRATWEAVAAAQQMGEPLTIVLVGAGADAAASEIAAAEAAEVILLEAAALAGTRPTGTCSPSRLSSIRKSQRPCSFRTRIRPAILPLRWRRACGER